MGFVERGRARGDRATGARPTSIPRTGTATVSWPRSGRSSRSRPTAADLAEIDDAAALQERCEHEALEAYERKEASVGADVMRELERVVLLNITDTKWREHLYEMDYLQEGIHLRAYAQRDPLTEYRREAFAMFEALTQSIREDFVKYIYRVELVRQEQQQPAARAAGPGEQRRGRLRRRRRGRGPARDGQADRRATRTRRSPTRSRATPPARAAAAEVQEVPRRRRPGLTALGQMSRAERAGIGFSGSQMSSSAPGGSPARGRRRASPRTRAPDRSRSESVSTRRSRASPVTSATSRSTKAVPTPRLRSSAWTAIHEICAIAGVGRAIVRKPTTRPSRSLTSPGWARTASAPSSDPLLHAEPLGKARDDRVAGLGVRRGVESADHRRER